MDTPSLSPAAVSGDTGTESGAETTEKCICQRHEREHAARAPELCSIETVFASTYFPKLDNFKAFVHLMFHNAAPYKFAVSLVALERLVYLPHSDTTRLLAFDIAACSLQDFMSKAAVCRLKRTRALMSEGNCDLSTADAQDLEDYSHALRVMETVHGFIRTRLPLNRLSLDDKAVAYLDYCAGLVPAPEAVRALGNGEIVISDADNNADIISAEGQVLSYSNAQANYQQALYLCGWALCELDRAKSGVERYMAKLGATLRIELFDEIEDEEPGRFQNIRGPRDFFDAVTFKILDLEEEYPSWYCRGPLMVAFVAVSLCSGYYEIGRMLFLRVGAAVKWARKYWPRRAVRKTD